MHNHDKEMFEEKESFYLSLSLYAPTNFPYSGSKPTFGTYHQNHKKAHKEMEVFRGPMVPKQHDQLCNLGIVFFSILSPFLFILVSKVNERIKARYKQEWNDIYALSNDVKVQCRKHGIQLVAHFLDFSRL